MVAATVAQRWLDHYGVPAREWLDQVPEIANGWAERWNLTLGAALQGGSVSVVLSVETSDVPAVLKLAAPWSHWSQREASALRAWDGDGAVRLLAASDDGRALLLERLSPGTPAVGADPAEIADLLKKLASRPIPRGLPSLSDAVRLRYRRAAENRHGLLTSTQVARARDAATALAESTASAPVLSHGDLLSKNILCSDERGFVAIDPNPCAGHVSFDAALWAGTEDPVADAPRRAADIATGLRIAPDEVVGWVKVLLAVEVCLAPAPRAHASLALAQQLDADWLHA